MKDHTILSTQKQRHMAVLGLILLVALVIPQLALADHSSADPSQFDLEAERAETSSLEAALENARLYGYDREAERLEAVLEARNAMASFASSCSTVGSDAYADACSFHAELIKKFNSGEIAFNRSGR